MSGYLDGNATEPLRPEAKDALLRGAEITGNPASVHAAGRIARRALEAARSSIAQLFDVDDEQVIFTSGGTEANALALHAFSNERRVLFGGTEHDSIRKPAAAKGGQSLPVKSDGTLCLESLERFLQEGQKALVCIMAANNETGVIHALTPIIAICNRYDAHLHVDAVQAAARMVMSARGIGSVAISGHKAGGLKGAGALLVPQAVNINAMVPGGGQERGRRGGTPALPALMSMAAAMEAARQQDWAAIASLRDALEASVESDGARIVGQEAPSRLANTSSIILPGMRAQAQLMALDLAGFCVSTGSACSSGKVATSHVLAAMGLGDEADNAIRVSLPWNVHADEVDQFCKAYRQMAKAHRRRNA